MADGDRPPRSSQQAPDRDSHRSHRIQPAARGTRHTHTGSIQWHTGGTNMLLQWKVGAERGDGARVPTLFCGTARGGGGAARVLAGSASTPSGRHFALPPARCYTTRPRLRAAHHRSCARVNSVDGGAWRAVLQFIKWRRQPDETRLTSTLVQRVRGEARVAAPGPSALRCRRTRRTHTRAGRPPVQYSGAHA